MELIILDRNFYELGYVDEYSSLVWHRRYYDYGSFELTCSITNFDLFNQGYYLFSLNKELAFIESVKYGRSNTNSYHLEVRGRFIISMLDDRVVVDKKTYNGTHEQIARSLLNEHFINPTDSLRKVANLSLGALNNLGVTTSLELNNQEIGDKLQSLLKEKELSHRIDYDYLTNQFKYVVWQGLNRTDNQMINSWALFGEDYDNVSKIDYSKSSEREKNVIYIRGNNVNSFINCCVSNERRKEKVITSSENTVTVLNDKGTQEIEKLKVVEVINCDFVISNNLKYGIDFDLGDVCTIKIKELSKMVDLRITEIKEVYEEGTISIEPIFGNDFISIMQLIERGGR